MRHPSIPAAALLVASLAVPWRPARQAAALQIAVEDAADLWSRPDGTGFANDVVRAAFGAAGVEVQLIVVPYARCKNMVTEGTVVACFTMSASPELKGKVLFPARPIFLCYTELVQNPGRPLPAARLQDLPRGTVIGTVLDYEYPPEVRAAQQSGRIVLTTSPSEEILMREVAAKRLDAALMNLNEIKSLEYIAALAGVTTGYESVQRVGTLRSFIGFSARNPRAIEARDAFDRGMQRITANGTLARVVRQWSDSSQAVVRARRQDKGRGSQ